MVVELPASFCLGTCGTQGLLFRRATSSVGSRLAPYADLICRTKDSCSLRRKTLCWSTPHTIELAQQPTSNESLQLLVCRALPGAAPRNVRDGGPSAHHTELIVEHPDRWGRASGWELRRQLLSCALPACGPWWQTSQVPALPADPHTTPAVPSCLACAHQLSVREQQRQKEVACRVRVVQPSCCVMRLQLGSPAGEHEMCARNCVPKPGKLGIICVWVRARHHMLSSSHPLNPPPSHLPTV